jgi:hypothetical protein
MIHGVGSDGDWRDDARTVRWLGRVLADEATARGWPMPESREELVTALMAVRERLRRRLLVAEGLDPDTGRPGA